MDADAIREAVRAELDARDRQKQDREAEATAKGIMLTIGVILVLTVVWSADWLLKRVTGFSVIRWVNGWTS